MKNEDSFIFNNNKFGDMLFKMKTIYGDKIDKLCKVDYNYTFSLPQSNGFREVCFCANVNIRIFKKRKKKM